MVRDGVEPRQQRTWYYWTVPGMFDTIGQELDKIDDPATGFGARRQRCSLRSCEPYFDGKLGYSAALTCAAWRGQNLDMGWTVTRFEAVEPSEASTEKEPGQE